MAINASSVWRIRVGGNNTNGGGFDASISGAGTDYTDQDAHQLNPTDLATSGAGATTVTSATGGFTAAMIGNCMRIASGTNFTAGYYFITARTDTNTITVDRSPTPSGAGSGGNGKIGGAFATFEPLMSTGNGGLSSPAIATPLGAGHTIYVRGAGSDTPSADDYDYKGSASAYQGYYTAPSGSLADGKISVIGYNGRPQIRHSGLLFFQVDLWHLENLKFIHHNAGTGWPEYGIIGVYSDVSLVNTAKNIVSDLNGIDGVGINIAIICDSEIKNSGGGAAGSQAGIHVNTYASTVVGCYVDGVRGDGIRSQLGGSVTTFGPNISFCVVRNVGRDGLRIQGITGSDYPLSIRNNTINNCGSDGIEITNEYSIMNCNILNNVISNNAGYGLNLSFGSAAQNDRRCRGGVDHNNYYNNTSGARNNLSAGANDTTLDPQFTDAANENYGVGTNMKATAFPGAFRGSASTGYLDKGAVQRQEPAGGGGSFVVNRISKYFPTARVNSHRRFTIQQQGTTAYVPLARPPRQVRGAPQLWIRRQSVPMQTITSQPIFLRGPTRYIRTAPTRTQRSTLIAGASSAAVVIARPPRHVRCPQLLVRRTALPIQTTTSVPIVLRSPTRMVRMPVPQRPRPVVISGGTTTVPIVLARPPRYMRQYYPIRKPALSWLQSHTINQTVLVQSIRKVR